MKLKSIRNVLFGRTGVGIPNFASRRDVAFLHIPKTGGTFLTQAETDGETVVNPIRNLGHVTVLDDNAEFDLDVAKPYSQSATIKRAEIKHLVIFSNVRNIYSFFVSYLFHAGGFNPKYRATFHYDFDSAQKGFDYLIKTIADRDELWPSRRFVNYMLFSQPSGEFIPTWLNYTETLDDDLIAMSNFYKLTYHAKFKQRVSGYDDYRRFYTPALIDIVDRTWARELSIFKFDFENSERWCGRAQALIALRNSNYVWRNDTYSRVPLGFVRKLKRRGN